MRVPYSWLQDYVELPENAHVAATLLQEVGVPVENVESEGAEIHGVLTCRIEEVTQHPDADRLRVCQVNIGEGGMLQIVTAAENVRVGQITAVATNGSLLASGTKIKKGKLRGVMSEGMFCGYEEIGMDKALVPECCLEGIMDFPADLPIGRPVGEVVRLAEDVLIIESFANRPDQLSIIGIARELAAKLHRPLKMPETQDVTELYGKAPANLVEIADLKACPRYAAAIVEDLKVGPSPEWMARRLESAGMRSVNNVVDITNYVMLELGQPLHAFDLDKVAGPNIIVRRAHPEEKLTTLDGTENTLPANAIVIADPSKPLAVAGVMGGEESEIKDETKRMLLEVACFDCGDVRRASLRLGLRTESSKRFEKGLDISRVDLGCARAVYLLNKYAGRVTGICVKGCDIPAPAAVHLREKRLSGLLGVEIERAEVKRILEALEFSVKETADGFDLVVPAHRQDIAAEVDVIEEIARHFGYDNLPLTIPKSTLQTVTGGDDAFEEWARSVMTRLGLTELLTPSLHSSEFMEKYRLDADPPVIMNPLSQDQRVLRPYIFPFLVETIGRNLRARSTDLRFFEISRVYEKKDDKVAEPYHMAVALSFEGANFFSMKGLLERFLSMAGIKVQCRAGEKSFLHPGCSAILTVDDREVAWLGELHPELARELEIEAPVVVAEVDLSLAGERMERGRFQPFSRFPVVERDFAFVVADSVPAGDMSDRILKICGDQATDAWCFDVYKGKGIEPGYKSLAFRVNLQAADHTLTDEEIQRFMKKIIKVMEREFEAKLRD